MMKRFLTFTVLLAVIPLSGCFRAPIVPPQGIIYSQFSAPLDISMIKNVNEGDNKPDINTMRVGVSQTQFLFEPILLTTWAWDDGSIERAAQNGNIETIYFADYEYTNVLGFYQNLRVKVYGE